MVADLVLIHGFWSSPNTWDRLIACLQHDSDLAGMRIHTFGYESPKLRWPTSPARIPDYNDIAQSLPAYLATHVPGATPIAVVTHSQGGLILQRFLAWMLTEGRGRELARFRLIIMLSCPNEGSEFLRSIRAVVGFNHHPQAGQLDVLDREVREARRIVLRQVVNAVKIDDRHCPIPVHVYSGRTDNIVPRESAQSVFPNAEVLPGDHFSILSPDAPGHLTCSTIKRHLLDTFAHPGRTGDGSAAGYSSRDVADDTTLPSDYAPQSGNSSPEDGVDDLKVEQADAESTGFEPVSSCHEEETTQPRYLLAEVVGTDRYAELMDALFLIDPKAELLWGQYSRFAARLTRADITEKQLEEVLAFRGLPYRISLESYSFRPHLINHISLQGPDGRRFEVRSVPNITSVQEISSSLLGEYHDSYFKEGDRRPVRTITSLVRSDGNWIQLDSNDSLQEAGVHEESLLMISFHATAG